jgi:hypothetical protein
VHPTQIVIPFMTHDTHPWTLTSQGQEPRQRASAVPVSSTYQNGLDRLGMHSTSTTKLYPKIRCWRAGNARRHEFSDRLRIYPKIIWPIEALLQ